MNRIKILPVTVRPAIPAVHMWTYTEPGRIGPLPARPGTPPQAARIRERFCSPARAWAIRAGMNLTLQRHIITGSGRV